MRPLIFLFILTSCSFGKYKIQEIDSLETATGYKMKKYGSFHFGGQPRTIDFIKLRQEGFVAIFNFREHKEDGRYNEKWERNNSLLSGMSYYHTGLKSKDPLTDSFISRIHGPTKTELKKGKILLHGKNNQRAILWISGHAYQYLKATKEQTIELAKKLGGNNQTMIKIKAFVGL